MQAKSFFHAAADAKLIIQNKNWSVKGQTSKKLASSVASSKVNLFLTHEVNQRMLVLVKWSKIVKALS